jgi:hypothetical protein
MSSDPTKPEKQHSYSNAATEKFFGLPPGSLIPYTEGETHTIHGKRVAPHDLPKSQQSDGSTASYYELPKGATELQDLIAYLDLNAQLGEILRACYRYGRVPHSPKLRDAKKIKFYAEAEIARLEKYEGETK